MLRSARDSLLLQRVDADRGAAEPRTSPHANFDKHQQLAFARNQVDFAVAIARIARNDAAAGGSQMPGGRVFRSVSGALLRSARSGRQSLQRATSSRSIVPLR